MERNIDFWPAYLLGLCMFIFGTSVLIFGKKFYVVRPPQGSVILNAFKAIGIMITRGDMNAPKPTYIAQQGGGRSVPWNDHFVDELQRALVAMRVFVFFPVFWVIYGQFSNNFVSQGKIYTSPILCCWSLR